MTACSSALTAPVALPESSSVTPSAWCAAGDSADLLQRLEAARVPSGPIYNVEDMLADAHFQERKLFETVEIDGQPLKIPAILPRLSRTPGATRWPGAALGRDNREVLGDLLGLSEGQLSELRSASVIADC